MHLNPAQPRVTKNGEGRVFPITLELRRILDAQQEIAATLKKERGLIARHVFCFTKGAKAGQGVTEGGYNRAWRKARRGRLPRSDPARLSPNGRP